MVKLLFSCFLWAVFFSLKYYMYLNTQESDVQKLQEKLNSGQIEEVIVQVKTGNLR